MNNTFINYLIESGISLGAMSLIYLLFFRNQTFFRVNRFYLLFSILFSSVLPTLHIPLLWSAESAGQGIITKQGAVMLDVVTVRANGFSNLLVNWIASINLFVLLYVVVSAIILLIVLFRVIHILKLIYTNLKIKRNGINYVYLPTESSPYSFLNYLFVSNDIESSPAWEKVLAHECEHIRQGHTVDILILELISIFQWFNPFFWLLRRIIKENHEFMADRAVLNAGVNIQKYKEALVTQFIGTQLSVANNFNSSLIKTRLKMMTKIESSKKAISRYSIAFIAVLGLLVVFACEKNESDEQAKDETGIELKSASGVNPLVLIDGQMADMDAMKKLDPNLIQSISVIKEKDNVYVKEYGDLAKNGVLDIKLKPGALDAKNEGVTVVGYGDGALQNRSDVFNIVEEMPQFPGGEFGLRKFIAKSVKYPLMAKEKGIQGKVYVTFVVEKDGSVGRCRIARGVDPSLDGEAIRVVNSLPTWKPGKQGGELVAVEYTVPISFVLQ